MTLIHVTCDLCGSDEAVILHPSTIPYEDGDPAIYFSSSRAIAGHLPIVRCQCGLVRTNPRDDEKTLARIYQQLEDASYDQEGENRLHVAAQRLKLISKHTTPSRILDIGCATGFFAGLAQQAGWQSYGVEPSPWAVEVAKSRYPAVHFQQGFIETANFRPATFDVITLWDVLEHLSSPTQSIQKINTWLAPDGLLFLNIPNIQSIQARWMGKHWVLFLREHLWFFSTSTIKILLEKSGFELVHCQENTVRFSIGSIINRIYQYQKVRERKNSDPIRKLKSWLASRSVQFPIGEITVTARKVK